MKDNDNPLKDTFQVKVKDVEKIKTTAEKIKKMEQVSVVNYGEAWVDKMISMFSVVEKRSIWCSYCLNFSNSFSNC